MSLRNFEPATVAAEILSRPSDAAFWDPRLYVTHGPIYSWAENSGDLIDESNHATILAELRGVIAWQESRTDITLRTVSESGDDDYDSDVIDAGIRHWAVGPCSQIFVRVYEPECSRCGLTVRPVASGPGFVTVDEEEPATCHGERDAWHRAEFTAVFLRACEILDALDGYPLFDDDDHSEREWAAYEEDLELAINSARDDFDDSDEDHAAIVASLYATLANGDVDVHSGHGYAEADYEAVAELYATARDARFEKLAAEFEAARRSELVAQCPGQCEI